MRRKVRIIYFSVAPSPRVIGKRFCGNAIYVGLLLDGRRSLPGRSTGLKEKLYLRFFLRLALNAFIYFTWEERNRMILCSAERDACTIVESIKEVIHIQIQQKNYRNNTVNT
ncbi:hypothetical protein GQ457_02G019720 [Hibiscus cannabinus]